MRIPSFILFIGLSLAPTFASAQNVLEAKIIDAESGERLPGANGFLDGPTRGSSAGDDGVMRIEQIPDGSQTIVFSFVGYQPKRITITFPRATNEVLEIRLSRDHEELDAVVITATRSSRTIADLPTRVEYIAGEELDEKANMKPGDIRMVLSESTGIHMQQTSATSANASIRIQGLDGRYTQILKDGFPLYAGFSGGLGLLQIPPLDLKQVEVIKGSSSTLYGGGAIAGLVNLVSRTPSDDRELRFFINGTSALGLDMSAFYSETYGKTGVTLFAARNSTRPYDPADIGLTAIPDVERYTFNPRLFVDIGAASKLNIALNLTTEDRIGGDMQFIKGRVNALGRYYESNQSNRYSSQIAFSHKFSEQSSLNIKNSLGYFDRRLVIPQYTFDGVQKNSFSELNFVTDNGRSEWIAGLNLWTDSFDEQHRDSNDRDYNHTTWGAFLQNSFSFSGQVVLETGLRADYVMDYGTVLLPRLSLLYKISDHISTRFGGGFGYKTPTIFTEETERIHYRNILAVTPENNELEKSYGFNWDVNYHFTIGDAEVSINHLLFYTKLNNPLTLVTASNETRLTSLDGHLDSKGTETNIKAELGDFKLFIGYTFTDTRVHEGDVSVQNPLTPRHRINNVLFYEVEDEWKIGVEAYYFDTQRLSDNSWGKDYWICGFMVEKIWERFSLFINFENFLDTRQTRFDAVYTGPIASPVFRDIYAPVDGFLINGGIKIDL